MKRLSACSLAAPLFNRACALLRRVARVENADVPAEQDFSRSYVGLFQGVLETATPASADATSEPPMAIDTSEVARPGGRAVASASGFVRLEVDRQKKATGCLMLFVDGRVLTGAVESAAERTGHFRAAHCRLDGPSSSQLVGARPLLVAATGRMQLQRRGPQCAATDHPAAGDGEKVTIRFV